MSGITIHTWQQDNYTSTKNDVFKESDKIIKEALIHFNSLENQCRNNKKLSTNDLLSVLQSLKNKKDILYTLMNF